MLKLKYHPYFSSTVFDLSGFYSNTGQASKSTGSLVDFCVII